MKINADISVGELVDKLSILEVKLKKIEDEDKLVHINTELRALDSNLCEANLVRDDTFFHFLSELTRINSDLWDVLDQQRLLESAGSFEEEFVSLSRQVYKLNDVRFSLKSDIDELYNSDFTEQKFYQD